jgi:F1F0 ATPase subunit 2
MNFLHLAIAFAAGMGLGVFYFGSLWLTVQELSTTQRPFLLLASSFLGRLGLTMVGFYLVMGSHWEALLAAVLGFMLTRSLLIQRWRPQQLDWD